MSQNDENILNNTKNNINFFNAIDDFLDNSLNKLNDHISNKTIKIDNIDNIVKSFIEKLDYSTIETILSNAQIIQTIKTTINNYYYIYLLLRLSFNMDIDEFRKMIIQQKNFSLFELNTSNLSLIIDKALLIKYFFEIIVHERNINKIPNLYKSEYEEALLLYDMFTNEEHNLFKPDIPEHKHSIIITIVYMKIYQQIDRIKIFKLIEFEELSKSEHTFIEIVESLVEEIDYHSIEKLFSVRGFIKKDMVDLMYDMLIEYDDLVNKRMLIDHKINELFANNILIPITDEFLRYHKDSERYEKNVGVVKIDVKEKTTKKDNTKIRYIVTKINKLIDYYGILRKNNKQDIEEVNKLIYPSLIHRKAVIINELEELSIINKIINQGKRAMENNEFYSDLVFFRACPYINFRDYKNYGFNFKPDESIETIRYCNFEYKDPEKYPIQYKGYLQTRVAPKDHSVNIVGIALNPIKISRMFKRKIASSCIKLNDTFDIGSGKNGYLSTLSLLKKQITENNGINKLPYWIFNKNNDIVKIKSYENLSQLNSEEYFKVLLGKIYDEIISLTYERIINKINSDKKNLFYYKNLIQKIQQQLLYIEQTTLFSSILGLMYYDKLSLYNIPSYDKNENKIPGLNTELIKTPTYMETQKKQVKFIVKKEQYLTGKMEDVEDELMEFAQCQHHITWNTMILIKKNNPNKFTQDLFKFIKKYASTNDDGEYICKSCKQFLDIKVYMHDTFANNLSNVALSVSLEADLENIPEYEKFSKAIKNMDKNVEKIGYISGIQQYIGSNANNKIKRQDIVKYTIDLVQLQFQNFDISNINMKKERLESANKLYGIDKDKSIYFIFEMDNNLFTYSSKDTDKYKRYKNNAIFAYMIFLILCELNTGQIMQLNYDKLINYAIFDKFAFSLFDGIKIRINNGNDISDISKYRLLCYLIYYMSSMVLKYNLWFSDVKISTAKTTINPQLQKIVIHTIIDLINSILEINSQKEKSYIYEYVATKFFIKLNSIYDNKVSKELIEQLSVISDKRIQIVNNKIKIKSKDPNLIIPLDKGETKIMSFGYKEKKILPGQYFIKSYVHDMSLQDIYGTDGLNEINKKYYIQSLKKIYSIYLNNGTKRPIILTETELNIDISILEKHANSVLKILIKNKNNIINKNVEKLVAINNELIENEKYQQEITKNLLGMGDIHFVVDNVINLMENIIGPNININNNNIYLKKTVYIIDHDHLGNSKSSPLIYLDTENKVEFKKNESFFKTDVYYYMDKARNITVFYHAYNLYLLGYKEMNKEYITLKNTNKYMKINHSIRNKLLLLGHSRINYQISNEIKSEQTKLIKFTENIIRNRIHNLKNIIKEFQMIIYQIKNKNTSTFNNVVKQFIDKFKSLIYFGTDGNRIFEEWKFIIDNVYFIPFKSNVNIDISGDILNVNKLLKLNNNDNILLYYLCQQIQEFIDINNDQYNKSKLVYLLTTIINQLFDQHNIMETIYMNNEVKKFNLLITNISISDTDAEIVDIDENIQYDDEKLTDEQRDKLENEIEDLKETAEGMDIDMEREEYDDIDDGMDMIQAEGRD